MGVDFKKANEEAEARWLKSCEDLGTVHLWKPIRDALHDYILEQADTFDEINRRIDKAFTVQLLQSFAIIFISIALLLK